MTAPRITPEEMAAAIERAARYIGSGYRNVGVIEAALDRAEAAERAGLRYYNADGSFTVLDSAEEVIERRRVAAQAIARLERERDEARTERTDMLALVKALGNDRDAWQAHAERLREALGNVLGHSGCPFCDAGALRPRVGKQAAFHDDDCPYAIAAAALAAMPATSLTERNRRVAEMMREACAADCDERAVLNDAVECDADEAGMAKDPQTDVVASAPGHRAIEDRECAASIRALDLERVLHPQGWCASAEDIAARIRAVDWRDGPKGEQT